MKNEFCLNNDKATIDFTKKYCNSFEAILDSYGFKNLIEVYLKKSKHRNTNNFKFLESSLKSEDISYITKVITSVFKLLTMMHVDEAISYNENFKELLEDNKLFLKVIEDIYSFWRKLERYTLIHNNKIQGGIAAVSFTEANEEFSKLILKFYRRIEKNLLGETPNVYRQVTAGGNACLMLSNVIWPVPKNYETLEDICFIDSISLEAPFITYPKKNKRDGIFQEIFYNPLKDLTLNKDEWFCYPAKVGELMAYVYFHRDFLSHGISLCNLFELAKTDEYRGRKPDIIYVFGAKEDSLELKTHFYEDKKNHLMVGYINYCEDMDYFGYMKKMILTLHNLIMIKNEHLPIHGAMVKVILKDGKEANLVIVGDSGAGKSESLEAFRSLAEEHISDMTIVFDDMGVLKLNKDKSILGYGTEIGAFVRLDDLDQGYAFKEIDRSIFMNPDKTNARLVMPVASYEEIVKGYKVDILLYANNYSKVDNNEKSISYFEDYEEAINVFKDGTRMAKGTTTELGLVKSYFANPFGPAQRRDDMEILIEKYFKIAFENNIKVGEIKTCLALEGLEKEGPRKAALELFKVIDNL
ncbi:MAG: phosphoenolpyruvate carboxykinase [Clostridium perfringens]|nr:phosphoenolpyruvate carboxykinase [Clostridium perfringens]